MPVRNIRKKVVLKQPVVVKKSLKERAIEFAKKYQVPLAVALTTVTALGAGYKYKKHLNKKHGHEIAVLNAKHASKMQHYLNEQERKKNNKNNVDTQTEVFSHPLSKSKIFEEDDFRKRLVDRVKGGTGHKEIGLGRFGKRKIITLTTLKKDLRILKKI